MHSFYEYSNRFVLIFNARGVILFITLLCVSVMFLKYILQQSISDAALEFLRILASASTLKQPKNYSKKVYFLSLILAVTIISSYIQSDLKVISILPPQAIVIDSTKDLIESNLTVHGFLGHKEVIFESEIREHYHALGFAKCFDKLFLSYILIKLKTFIHQNITW